ncbi:MAG TPA: NUDIX hydrolase [Caulobacteraceae bacterium]|nr:NUDIX hydrolase [Caulobacteraceae bacterium]
MTPRILQQTVIHQGWGRYLLLQVDLGGGVVVERQMDDHGSAACVLPYDAAKRTAFLVRLIRAGPLFKGEPAHLVEAAAGIIDTGETGEACARREAMEETGLRLGALEPVAFAWASPSISTERIDLYLAPVTAADRVAAGGGLAEEHEGIEVLEVPLAELWRATQAGEIHDLKTLVLIYALHARRPELF